MQMLLWVCLIFFVVIGPGNCNNGTFGGTMRMKRNLSPSSPRIQEVFNWKQMDFVYPTPEARAQAIESGDFVEVNSMLPMGVHASGNRVFITIPRMRRGVPSTLNWVAYPSANKSPQLNPYPNLELNRQGNCQGFTSVFRVMVDECNRLWIIDNGSVDLFVGRRQICPAKVVVIDLTTDQIIYSINLPQNVLRETTLPVTIDVEFPNGSCRNLRDAVVYLADVFTYAIIVVDLATERAWRVADKTVYPAPEAGTYNVAGETMERMDGVLGITLDPRGDPRGQILYFSAMSTFNQRWVRTSVLRNQSTALTSPRAFFTGTGRRSGQSAGASMDNNGVLFFGLLNSDALVCWNSKNRYEPQYIGEIAKDATALQFLATVMVDRSQRLWALSSRFLSFALNTINPLDTNFRVFMNPSTTEAVKGTVCEDPYFYPVYQKGAGGQITAY